MIYKMAYRNIFRHKKRTFFTLFIMIVGILLAVAGEGLNIGLEYQIIDTLIKSEIGQNKIYKRDFYENKDEEDQLEYLYPYTEEIKKRLELDKN